MGELQLSHWEKLPNNIDHWPEICELDSVSFPVVGK